MNDCASTIPSRDNLKWNRSRIVEYLILRGTNAKVVGSPKTVVDELERRVEVADVDGFNLSDVTNPDSSKDIIDFVVPELQKRGLFRTKVEKKGAPSREACLGSKWLLEDHSGRKLRPRAGDEVPGVRGRLGGVGLCLRRTGQAI